MHPRLPLLRRDKPRLSMRWLGTSLTRLLALALILIATPTVSPAATPFDELPKVDGTHYSIDWFGFVYPDASGWHYHYHLGWFFPIGDSFDNLWLYLPDLGWTWTARPSWPFLFVQNQDAWAVYDNSPTELWNVARGRSEARSRFNLPDALPLTLPALINKTIAVSTDTPLLTGTVTITKNNGNGTGQATGLITVSGHTYRPIGTIVDTGQNIPAIGPGRQYTINLTQPGTGAYSGSKANFILDFQTVTNGTAKIDYAVNTGGLPLFGNKLPGTFHLP